MKIKLAFLFFLTFFRVVYAQTIPMPDHVVILMMENYGYSNIIGNSNAPHINALINDPHAALFTQSYGLTHPSQPNYIMLYSGDNQGITTDNIATNTPFNTCNLGASLIGNGYSFKGYSEDLPSAGDLIASAGDYVRRHCPWTNWIATSGNNTVDPLVHQPFTSFPANTDYSSLPTVSFVIPNLANDMHNPTFPVLNYPSIAISNGDTWLYNNLTDYINWAKNNNSLLIITFDEDDGYGLGSFQTSTNNITTIFIGAMIQGGTYTQQIDHYIILRTIENMYNLPYCGNSASSNPITNCWTSQTTGITNIEVKESLTVAPNPVSENITLNFYSDLDQSIHIKVIDILSQTVIDVTKDVKKGMDVIQLPINNLLPGSYVINVTNSLKSWTKKVVIQ